MNYSVVLSTSFVLFFSVFAKGLAESTSSTQPFAGKPFTDPEITAQKPKHWIEQPIRRIKDKEGVDLAVVLDQQLYRFMLKTVQKFSKNHQIDIDLMEGRCGNSKRMMNKKVGGCEWLVLSTIGNGSSCRGFSIIPWVWGLWL